MWNSTYLLEIVVTQIAKDRVESEKTMVGIVI